MGGGGSALRVCAEHRGGINWLSLSPDGQRLLTGSEDGTARLWSTADGQCCALLRGTHAAPPAPAALSFRPLAGLRPLPEAQPPPSPGTRGSDPPGPTARPAEDRRGGCWGRGAESGRSGSVGREAPPAGCHLSARSGNTFLSKLTKGMALTPRRAAPSLASHWPDVSSLGRQGSRGACQVPWAPSCQPGADRETEAGGQGQPWGTELKFDHLPCSLLPRFICNSAYLKTG